MTGFLHYIALPIAKTLMLAQLTVCPPPDQAPHVDIFFLADKPTYVTEAPVKALTQEMRGNPDSTFATDSRWMVEGITEASVGNGQFHVAFDGVRDHSGNTCLNVLKVDFIIRYSPTIFLAKELQAPGLECRRKMTKLHEERHVATDLKTINEYIPKIKMDLLWYLRSLGPQGPYPETQIPQKQKELMGQISKAATPMVDKLVKVRRDRQGSIDTIENYRRESALCPGEFPKIEDTP